MSDGERKIADVQGQFAQVVKNGRELTDAEWTGGRILLTNKRLVLVGGEGKQTVALSSISTLGGRKDLNQEIAHVGDYLTISFDDDAVLVTADDVDEFRTQLFHALLDQAVVLVRHPAVAGGVVQDTDWEKGRLELDGDDALHVAVADGSFVQIELDDVGMVETGQRTVADETRTVVEAEHSEDGTSVQTYLLASPRRCSFLETLLTSGVERSDASLDLDNTERQVLMALYSGVSPFEIPDFIGIEVDAAEDIFERLVELDVLDEVRKRREVALTTRGRNMASESIGEQ